MSLAGSHAEAAELSDGWVSFDGRTLAPTAPTIQLISAEASRVVLRIDTPGVLVESVEHDAINFKRLSLPSYFDFGEIGHPALTAVRTLVAVPNGCEVGVSAVALDSLLFTDCTVYPVEEPVVKYTEEGWEYIDYEFAYDGQAYSRSGYCPGPSTSIGDVGSFRGQGVVRLGAYPMQTDPTTSQLRVYPSMVVTLELTGGTGGMSENLGPFSEIAEALILGYDGAGSAGWREAAGPGRWGVCRTVGACADSLTDYLMIVEGSLMGSPYLGSLAEHRATYNGFNVAIVPDTTVVNHYGQPTISDVAIRHFIQSLYETESAEHMQDSRLGYVLLVGDARDAAHGGADSLLPAHEIQVNASNWATNDLWYSCVDGDDDLHPDLMIGRLCVSDVTELAREVQKIVGYEVDASSTDEWRNRILMTSGFCTDADANKVATAYAAFDSARALISGHAVTEIHAVEQDGVTCLIKQQGVQTAQRDSINGGLHLVELCAHGAPHECDTFKRVDVALLTNNGGQLPFWMNYSCRTGAYDVYTSDVPASPWDCLGEALMHQEAGLTGAVGFFGSSENCSNVWGDIGMYVWESIYQHGCTRTGDFITFAKLKFQSLRTDSEAQYRHDLMYNLLGDPALDLFLTDTGTQGYSSAPDYIVRDRDIELSPASPSFGVSTSIAIEVRNESNYIPGTPVDVLFLLWNPENAEWDTLGWDDVQPSDWSSETASVQWTPSQSDIGRTELRVRVDPEGEQDELSELNNEAERPVCVYFERDGFPRDMWGVEGVAPVFVDIDGDGLDDVVSGTRIPGHIAAFSSSSAESLWAYTVPSGAALLGPVAIADLNVDGEQDIVFTRTGYVDALGLDGDAVAGWSPRQVPGLVGAATLADMGEEDSLGDLEIIVEWETTGLPARHGVRVIDHDGTGDVWDVSCMVASVSASFLERAPLAVDITGDGRCEVVASYRSSQYQRGDDSAISVHAADDGSTLWSMESVGEFFCSPVAADVVEDSTGIEVLFAAGTVMCVSSHGYECWKYDLAGAPAGVAVGDVDADGEPEVVVTTYRALESLEDCAGVLYVIDSAGSIVDSFVTDRGFTTQPVMADLDGDGNLEIIAISCRKEMLDAEAETTSHLEVLTFEASTLTLEPFDEIERPLLFWGMATGTPAVRDTDDDGSLEIWLADGVGMLHCLDLGELPLTGEPSRWSMFQHDERHTGVYETPVSGAYPTGSTISWWGDYILSGDVIVDGSSGLLIQSGTTVRVATDDDQGIGVDPDAVELIIQGDITAVGDTATAPIRFMSAAASPAPGDWYGITPIYGSHSSFVGCIIEDAFIGIAAQQPDSIHVQDCRITGCDAIGIKCIGQQGTADVLIQGNDIRDAETGLYLGWCDATVDSNTITDCGSYGIRMMSDYESDITGNTISFPFSASGGPFSGISLDCTINRKLNTLEISGNTITNARTSGIACEDQGLHSDVNVTGNTIFVEQFHPTSKGMYFDLSRAIPRNNVIDGVRDAFWIENATATEIPNLGITMGDGGYNCVDGTWLRYGVRADPYCLTTVMAEANWWGTANPSVGSFMGLVDWHPFLVADTCDPTSRGEGAEQEHLDIIPFCLIQNAPNPFNPTTSLRFGLPAQQHVTLSVYDVAGRCVRTLVDADMELGWHDVIWDGRGDDRQQVASGVYFCRLISQGSTSVKKVILLK